MQTYNLKIFKNATLKTVVFVLLFFASIYVFVLLAHEVVAEKEDEFDTIVFYFIKQFTTPFIVEVFKVISFFGSTYFLLPAYVIIIAWLLIEDKKELGIDMALIGLSSTGIMYILKGYFKRNRPELPLIRSLESYSFPSGHALSSFIFFSILVYFVWISKRLSHFWKWILIVFLLLFPLFIGISRIVLRYHFASDVMASFAFGTSWVLLSLWIRKKVRV